MVEIRPVAQLSNDNQIIDVLTTMDMVDSFNRKPIDELYGELCRLENLRMVNECTVRGGQVADRRVRGGY